MELCQGKPKFIPYGNSIKRCLCQRGNRYGRVHQTASGSTYFYILSTLIYAVMLRDANNINVAVQSNVRPNDLVENKVYWTVFALRKTASNTPLIIPDL